MAKKILKNEIEKNSKKMSGFWQRNKDDKEIDIDKALACLKEKEQKIKDLEVCENKFSSVFESVPVILGISTIKDGEFIEVNKAFLDILGYKKEEVLGKTSADLKLFVDYNDRKGLVAELKKEGRVRNREIKIRSKKGGIFVFLFSVEFISFGGKKYLLTMANDITKIKQIESSLKENEKKYKNIIENSDQVFYAHDTKHVLTFVSQKSKEIFGYTPEEMMIKWTNLATDNPINNLGLAITEKALKTGEKQKPYLLELKRKNGQAFLAEISESPIKDEKGKVVGVIGGLSDVSEREENSRKLKESEEKYRLLMDGVLEGIMIVDFKGKTLFGNKSAAKIMEFDSVEEAIGRSVFKYVMPESRKSIIKDFYNTIKGKGGYISEYKIKTNKGKILWVESLGTKVKYEGKWAVVVAIRDVTDKRKTEEKFKILTEQAPIAVYYLDMKGRFVYGNKKAQEIIGYSEEEVIGKHFVKFGLVDKTNAVKAMKIFYDVLKKGYSEPMTLELNRKDKRKRMIELRTSLIEAGGEKLIMGMAVDVTEREEAQKQVIASEEKYRYLFDNSLDFQIALDSKGYIKDINKTGLNIGGYKKEEVVGKHVKDFVRAKNLPVILKDLALEFIGKRTSGTIIDIKLKNGEYAPFEFAPGSVELKEGGKTIGVVLAARDIRERLKSEAKVKESEEKYKLMFELNNDLMLLIDKAGIITAANARLEATTGYKREEVIGLNLKTSDFFKNLVDKESYSMMMKNFQKRLANEAAQPYVIKIKTKQGGVRYGEVRGQMLKKGDEVFGDLVFIRDITEEKEASEKIKTEKSKAEQYLDMAGSMIVALDNKGRITLLNKAGYKVLGYKEGELESKDWFQICIPEKMRAEVKKVFNQLMRGNMGPYTENYENLVLTKSGEERLISWFNKIIKDKDGKIVGTLGSGRDITDAKKAEIELKSRLEELKRINAMMVGREIKMKELKERISELEAKTQDKK